MPTTDQSAAAFMAALAKHTEDELGRYGEVLRQLGEHQHLIERHFDSSQRDLAGLQQEISEVGKAVERVAASSLGMAEQVAASTAETSRAITGINTILTEHEHHQNELHTAFLRTEDGRVDLAGHAAAHDKEKRRALRRQKIKDATLIGLLIAFFGWVGTKLAPLLPAMVSTLLG